MLLFVTLNWKPFDNHVRGLVTHKTKVSKPSQKPLKKTFRNLSIGFRVYWEYFKLFIGQMFTNVSQRLAPRMCVECANKV